MASRHARRANVPVQEMICSKIDKIISDLTHQPLSEEKLSAAISWFTICW